MRSALPWCLVLMLLLPACGDDNGSPDTRSPGRVTDLAVRDSSGNSVTLVWTAPGNDGMTGRAALYDIRRALGLLDEARWDSAVIVDTARVPKPAGQAETLVVTGLMDGAWRFALKTADEAPNWSELSKVAGATLLDTIPPGPVTDLEVVFASVASVKLRWTAPGDIGASGRAGQYDLRHALSPLTEEAWSGAQRVEGLPTPAAAGTAESLIVSGLEMGTTYSFALKATDDALNESALSNVATRSTASLVRLTTSPGGPMQFGAFRPAWSPDGETIAFDADWGSTYPHTDIYLIPATGGP